MKTIEAHPIAALFPMMDAAGIKGLAERIKKNGQREYGIVLDGKLLDGRNRQAACALIGVQMQTVNWDSLPESQRAKGPLEYVMDKNDARRHLSTSQRAAVAADYAEMLEVARIGDGQPKLKSSATAGGKTGDETSQETKHDPADEDQRRGRGKGKSAAKAAKKFNVSTRSVETAKALKKKNPKKFKDVKSGKTKLGKAARDVKKEASKKDQLEAAYKRIGAVCGRNLMSAARDGTRLKGRKQVIEFASLGDDDMKRTQGLVESGWPVAKARLYKAKKLERGHKIGDLLDRTAHEGGKFEYEVEGWTIAVKRKEK